MLSIGIWRIMNPTAFCLLRNDVTIGLRCLVVSVLKVSPKVRSDMTSKKRSRKTLLASMNLPDAAYPAKMLAMIE
jgi:hypothetical protein